MRSGIFLAPFHSTDEDPILAIRRDLEINDLFFISYFDVFVVTASLVVKCKAPLNEQFHLRAGVRNLLHRISRLPDDNEQPNFC